ncbi:MORN repeat-containing protein [Aureibaculum conchae]|uniref:MORN repeat-containing protein n=1 Tax=Aureibaculum sp. 2308TA14-22 TaxID=3108392 RepID=UPI00339AB890
MKKIVLLIAVFLVFSSAYAQHYFTLSQLEKICFKLNNDDIYAVRDYVQNVGYTALKVDDFYTFDDKFGNYFITSRTNSGKSKYVAFILKNPSDRLVKSYMNDLKNKYTKSGKLYYKNGLYIILPNYDKEKDKFTITVAYNRRLEYPLPVVNLGNRKYQVSSFSTLTPIKLKKGEKITLKASGKISVGVFAGSSGPNGIKGYELYNAVGGFPHGSLLGRIGSKGKWFLIGTQKSIKPTKDGYLDVRVNDLDPSNNSGYYYLTYAINGAFSTSFNPTNNNKKAICLSGNCQNGFGTKSYANGDTYTGYFKNSFREGKGYYFWKNGDKYHGKWIKDKRTGTGTLTWKDGNKFTGTFKDGKRVDGKGIFKWKSGSEYEGEFINSLMHGKGQLNYATGETYKGDFVKNKRHGEGKLFDKNGILIYEGLWEQDKKVSN